MCACSLSHEQFVYASTKPDLGWCHMQLLCGWQTVSAPQHGALWFACQADWQVNDTNESQPSLPLGARHWVTACKQPKRVSLNLKVIYLANSLWLFLLRASLFLLPLGLPILSLSLWLLFIFSPSFQVTLFLSVSVGIFRFHWRPLSFFNSLPSSPLFLPFTLSVTALCCFLSLFHQLLRSSLTASQSKFGWKVF